jgi:PEGA domain
VRILAILLLASLACAAADNGRLKTEVEPGRAGVFIDGKYVGPAANFKVARKYEVAAGEHEIKLEDPRYQEIVKKVTIAAGKTTVMKETMVALPPAKPPFGKLRVENADHFAAVYVNDRFMGHVDEFSNFAQALLLNPGTYEVRVVPMNGAPVTKTVTIEAEKTVIVK